MAQTAAQLLQKNGGTLGRAKKKCGIDFGNIYSFIKDIYRKDSIYLTPAEFQNRRIPVGASCLAGQCHGRDAGSVKTIGHKFGMLYADAESKSAHSPDICQTLLQCPEYHIHTPVVSGIKLFQFPFVIVAPHPANR
jgi:hypothetical protein